MTGRPMIRFLCVTAVAKNGSPDWTSWSAIFSAERERLNRPEQHSTEHSARYGDQPQGNWDTVREVNLPDLETKVTESQREAWALGYQAGLSDAQSGGGTTVNPFHPLRQETLQNR
jgi:hypothetical protein